MSAASRLERLAEVPGSAAAPPVALLGCVTGYAKEVVRNIRRAAISRQLQNFLLEVYARSFGDAGYQRRAGLESPGGSCAFDNASWARELGMQRQHTYRLRVRAVELGILFYDEDPADESRCRLRWNLAFDDWQPLDAEFRRQRYSRPGSGRKSNGLRTVDTENKSNGLRSPDENKSNWLRQPTSEQIKLVTLGASKSGQEAGRGDTLRKGTEERDTKKIDANASSAAISAGASAPLSSTKKRPKLARPERELSPDHQYRVDLLAALKEANGGQSTGERGAEWKAAGILFAWPGGPPPIEQVVDCFTISKQLPRYDTKDLALVNLTGSPKHFAAYLRSGAEAYRRGIERSRAAADGTLEDRDPQSRKRGDTRHAQSDRSSVASLGSSNDASRFPDPFERTKQRLARVEAERQSNLARERASASPNPSL